MATKIVLVLVFLAFTAVAAATPAQVLETQSIRVGFEGLIGEIAGENPGALCTSCQPIGACAGRCCNSPPYYCCISSGGECYCGCRP